jgi:hypothetical protein
MTMRLVSYVVQVKLFPLGSKSADRNVRSSLRKVLGTPWRLHMFIRTMPACRRLIP